MQPTTSGVIPFNFFGGRVPTVATPIAWAAGYIFVVTSIALSWDGESGATNVLLTDPTGSVRWNGYVSDIANGYGQRDDWQGLMVLGDGSGAQIEAGNDHAFITIDGFALLPADLPIW